MFRIPAGIRWWPALPVTIILLFALGCEKVYDLRKIDVLIENKLRCENLVSPNSVEIWRVEPNNPARHVNCKVKITYSAGMSEGSVCDAQLSWENGDGTKGSGTKISKRDGEKSETIENIKVLSLSCGGAGSVEGESCKYKITEVSCLETGESVLEPDALDPEDSKTNSVDCGKKGDVIWNAREDGCSATVRWKGGDTCEGILKAYYRGGASREFSARKNMVLKTLYRVDQLGFECKKGTSESEKCEYTIVSTQCP